MAQDQYPTNLSVQEKHARVLKGPLQVAFDLTNKCNFRCLHCYNLSGDCYLTNEELNDDEVIKFVEDLAKLKPYNVCFCGGEPLLRKKLLYKVAEILSKAGCNVSLVTNGSLVSYQVAKEIKESGINNVQVSLDGARPETHERLRRYTGSFELAVKAIEYFCELGIKNVSIAFAPTKFNCSEFEETFHLVRKIGVKEIRVQPLMILGRTQINLEELVPSPLQYRLLVRTILKIEEDYKCPYIEWGDPVDHLIRFRTLAQHCVTYVTIRANGDIVPSPYLSLTIGNIRKHSFKEYWDKGLARIWELPIVKKFAEEIVSIRDFYKCRVYFDKNIVIDIIDDKCFD